MTFTIPRNFNPYGNASRISGHTEQTIAITDIVSEGPIAGLVHGGRSIFLDSDVLFDDSEVGYSSIEGQTVSTDPTDSTNKIVNINEYVDLPFDYAPDSENQAAGSRFLFVHNVFEVEDSEVGPASYTYNSSSSSDTTTGPNSWQPGRSFFNLVIDGDFTSIPAGTRTNLQTTEFASTLSSNLVTGDGIVVVSSKDGDRSITGTVTSFSTAGDQVTIKLSIATLDNGYEWIKETYTDSSNNTRSNLKISFSQFLKIDNITGTTITLQGPVYEFSKKTFSITKLIHPGQGQSNTQANKIRSSGYQFTTGTKDQQPLQSISGGVGSTSVPLQGINELQTGVPKSITYKGANAGTIDTVHLLFKYPSGLYGMNMDDGKKRAAAAAYVIHLALDRGVGTTSNFENVGFLDGTDTISSAFNTQLVGSGGNSVTAFQSGSVAPGGKVTINNTANISVTDVDTPIFSHGAKQLAGVAFTHTVNLEQYQPFRAFKLTIVRLTESQNTTDEKSGRAHAWSMHGGVNNLTMSFEGKDDDSTVPKIQAIQSSGIAQAFGTIKERLNYPYTSVSQITFNTRQFSNMPKRAYECYGLKIRVPKNYTPREQFGVIDASHTLIGKEQLGSMPEGARLYNGLFTGELTENKKYTNNPAWVFYDIVTNNRYGAGEYVRDTDIDIFSLYKIARYCDELVSDGKGGVEPRFTANVYLQKAVDVYKVLKDMATIFRGMLYYMNGQITPIIDEPRVAIYNFNRTNVVDGNFSFEYTGTKTRVNQVVVKWNNPQNDYKIEPLFVEDRENIVRSQKIIKSEAFAFGCTSEGQAIRYGRWKLWTSLNQTEVVSFRTSVNAAFLAPGDLINVQDNHDFGYAYGGRLKNVVHSSGTTTLDFDRDIAKDLEGVTTSVGSAGNYKIALVLADHKVLVKQDAVIENHSSFATAGPVSAGTAITGWYVFNETLATYQPISVDNGGLLDWTEEEYVKYVSNAAADTDGTPLHLEETKETRVKEISTNQDGTQVLGSTLTTSELTSNEATAAKIGSIWALKDETETEASYKQYKILTIAEESGHLYDITAVEHYNTKFDIIETNFSTALPDPLFPVFNSSSVLPPPKGLRILRAPKLETPGEEVILTWEAPDNLTDIVGYEVSSTVPGYERSITTSTTSLDFVEVPEGIYTFTVSSFASTGKVSKPISISVDIEDYFGGSHTREIGVLVGGQVSSKSVVTTTVADKNFRYGKPIVFFLSPNDLGANSKELDLAGSSGLNYEILGAHRTESWWNSFDIKEEAYVFLRKYRSSQRSLRLINHTFDSTLNLDYWYDQTKATQKRFNLNTPLVENQDTGESNHYPNNPDNWSLQSGQVTIDNNSSKVVGQSTSFLTQYKPTNVIKFSDSTAAKISYIESNTVMYIDKTFDYKTTSISTASVQGNNIRYTAQGHTFVVGDAVTIFGMNTSSFNSASSFSHHSKNTIVTVVYDVLDADGVVQTNGYFEILNSNAASSSSSASSSATATTSIGGTIGGQVVRNLHYRDELDIDYTRDFLIGKLGRNGNFESFCTINSDIDRARTVTLDSNIATLNYDTVAGIPVTHNLLSTYSNIILTGIASGFEDAEVQVTGDFLISSVYAADTGYSNISNSDTGVFTKQLAGASSSTNEAFTYGNGSPLVFTVTVREKNDPSNANKTVVQNFNIVRIKDGASGTEGRTVAITASDNTIVYDSSDSNPNPSTITFTANAFNFPSDAKYRFKDHNGNVLKDWSNSTVNNIPANQLGPITAPNSSQLAFTGLLPNNGTTSLKTVEVEVSLNETPEVVSATDSTPVLKLGPGSPAFSISLPNNTVSIVAGSDGATVGTTVPGTAAEIEVFFGSTVGTYVGTTSGNSGGVASNSSLSLNEWYISAVSTSDSNLTAGNVTSVTNNIVSIADAIRSGELSGQNETITWTITGKDLLGDIHEKTVSQTIFKSIAGQAGNVTVDVFATTNSTTAPSNPSGTYSFNTNSFSFTTNPNNTWSSTQSAITSSARYTYKLTKSLSFSSSDITIGQNDWTGPILVASFGEDAYSSSGQNTFHLFVANENGIVDGTANNFSTSFLVKKGTTSYTFATSGTVAGTYEIELSTPVNCVGSVSSSGIVTLSTANSTIFTSAAIKEASLLVKIKDREDDSLISETLLRFTKVNQAVRDGVSFSFTNVGTTHGPSWAGSLSNATAQYAAQQVIATSVDGFISPNDKVTLIQGETAGTRIYQGTRTDDFSSSGPVVASSWSSLVTDFIDGSAIVSGTLSANAIAANTVLGNAITAGDRITVGTSSAATSGKINSVNKTSFGDNDPGFYMDGSGDFVVGNSTNYFKFDASAGTIALVAPSIQLRGPPGPPGPNSTIPGPPGTSVTITNVANTATGTDVTITDGTTTSVLSIDDGTDGNTQGVKVFYADDASGTNQSTTRAASHTFVKYVEYTGTVPSSGGTSGFVQFIGTDGTTQGVIPIYSDRSNPSQSSHLSFTPTSSTTHVTFFEYTGTKPTSFTNAILGATYVKYIGTDGTSASVSVSPTSTGTNVTFTGATGTSTFSIPDGIDGTTQGVKVFYSTAASGGSVSTTQGNRQFVKYEEYTGTAPTTTTNSGFVRFIGTDGDTEGVIPIYSSVADPTTTNDLSFTPGNNEYVTFFEYTGTKPTSLTTAMHQAAYVKFTGADGSAGFLYVNQNNALPPSSASIPVGSYVEGAVAIVENNTGTQAAFRYNSSNQWAAQTLVTADIIKANAIGAEALEISANSPNTASSIFMDGSTTSGPRIVIKDSNGAERVILGRLA